MSMNGGDGECSYNRMSVVQEYALHGLQPFFSEAVHQMTLPHQPQHQNDQNELHEVIPCLRLADFGSSTGRNAFIYMEFLVSRIRQEYKHRNLHMPEVQVFFNDLPGNDFNSMFGMLPPIKHEDGESGRIRDYFAAGVPGSFYGRLFPKESLHFAVSLHCLHWISQVHSNSILIYHHHILEPSALTFLHQLFFFQCTTFKPADMHVGLIVKICSLHRVVIKLEVVWQKLVCIYFLALSDLLQLFECTNFIGRQELKWIVTKLQVSHVWTLKIMEGLEIPSFFLSSHSVGSLLISEMCPFSRIEEFLGGNFHPGNGCIMSELKILCTMW